MKSLDKYIVELDGRAVYSSRCFDNSRRVLYRLINKNPYKEVILQLDNIICIP